MDQLKVLLAKYLQVTNISINPIEDGVDLKKIFSEAANRGYLSKASLQEIEAFMK